VPRVQREIDAYELLLRQFLSEVDAEVEAVSNLMTVGV
jgi:hypothetical protein